MDSATRTPPVADFDHRLGSGRTALRLAHEARLWDSHAHARRAWYHPARYVPMRRLVEFGLTVSGLRGRAFREFLAIQLVENPVVLRHLPPAFEGFRLLQISDLHADIHPRLVEVVAEIVSRTAFDQAVLTGDYHDRIGDDWSESLALTRSLLPHLGPHPIAILGNHDRLDFVGPIEQAGARILLNENIRLTRDSDHLWICGVDDPDEFQTHDLTRARAGVPADGCAILLAHTPATYREAATAGYALQLSGHTHGGQICLPGGIAVIRKAPVPNALIAGPWTHADLIGYTSRGTGSCTAPARLNCPPEITLHILHTAR